MCVIRIFQILIMLFFLIYSLKKLQFNVNILGHWEKIDLNILPLFCTTSIPN